MRCGRRRIRREPFSLLLSSSSMEIIHVRSYISWSWRLNFSTSSCTFYSTHCLSSLSLSIIHERDYNIYTTGYIYHLINSYRDWEEWRENKLYAHIHTNIKYNCIFTFVLCDVHFQGFARECVVTNCFSRILSCRISRSEKARGT